ncbi:unnamed protein product [Phyllotreta striolata]|uniref:Uncharacterized protein n=1 Tax=Phyllotreta striolata TaxID=444603 RepID=A0A9N9TQL2_PHYSR|nr:unnamed protein product [Phyllotreta striolata]
MRPLQLFSPQKKQARGYFRNYDVAEQQPDIINRHYYNQNMLSNQGRATLDEINRGRLKNREKIAALFRRPQYRPINSPNFRGRGGRRNYKPIIY